MKFKEGHEKIGGRQKGSKNKTTKAFLTVKETVLNAFNELQEDPKHNIISFAKEYPKEFYAIAAKLIPTEIKGSVEAKIITVKPPKKE